MKINDRHTFEQQVLLSRYVRTGEEAFISQLHNVRPEGIKHYRRLIFSIVNDAITTAFPIMTDFFGKTGMDAIVDRFFTNHECKESKLWAMPGEFYEYVMHNERELLTQHPFLSDLMLFEWEEVRLYMMPDIPARPYTISGSIFNHRLVINPEFSILSFEYPVFLLHPKECTKQSRGEYLLLMYRHQESKDVVFCAISYAVEKFLKLLTVNPFSFNELEEVYYFKPQEILQIKAFIPEAIKQGIILGFVKH
ncbi:MAG: putative DNA-binding domain-containing protein [Thermaurantimonas sp.]